MTAGGERSGSGLLLSGVALLGAAVAIARGGVHQGKRALGRPHVGLENPDLAGQSRGLFQKRTGGLIIAQIGGGHQRPFHGEAEGNGPADSTCTAGYHHCFSAEFH